VYADYVLTESGGYQMPTPDGIRLPVLTGEKGTFWSKLRVRGTPGHGSQPYRTDNALVKAAEVVRRIDAYQPQTQVLDVWKQFVQGMGYPPEITEALLDPEQVPQALAELPLGMSRLVHACTHTTFAPTIMHGGTKTNVIPDLVELEVDVRTLPGQTGEDARAMLDEALGDLADDVEIESNDDGPTESPIDTPLWDSSWWAARTTATSAAPAPSVTGSRCSVGASRSRTTPRCSTATTSASTSNLSASANSSGKPSRTTC
jgi:acetylornithine deacetylase/succinyl-diaminopimelate desuccinylase-like protein